jgi:hypothetical protein
MVDDMDKDTEAQELVKITQPGSQNSWSKTRYLNSKVPSPSHKPPRLFLILFLLIFTLRPERNSLEEAGNHHTVRKD